MKSKSILRDRVATLASIHFVAIPRPTGYLGITDGGLIP
jgi:hypothetical protein